ncbi:MAG: 16S rRNA processing protein RimM [Oscillospiraceae bacterium]|nr:16S rRNA processing protein RimM [Oscillospiraceae bacterium]
MKQEYLEAGKIVSTFGVRGEVKLQPWCDGADFLRPFRTLYIDGAPRRVVSSRVHKDMLIVQFEGVEDVSAAMALKDKVVTFARADAKLPEGRFFIADILGARVVDEAGAEVGRLTEVLDLPAGQVYVVQGESEHTIPNRPEFILGVDTDSGLIRVHMIEGL